MRREVFRETFVSPFQKELKSEAQIALNKIRECHSAEYGWEEKDGYVEQLENGKWRAVRVHIKYA